MSSDAELIRNKFGEAIRKYRKDQDIIISQERLCEKINKFLRKERLPTLYQELISRIELGNNKIVLPSKTVLIIAKVCNIPSECSKPYLELMNKLGDFKRRKKSQICIKEHNNLLVEPTHSEIQAYIGEYFCYFHSTNSSDPKINKGILFISQDYEESICSTRLLILRDDEPIKEYHGQLLLNLHYRKAYMILLGKDKQEICFLILNHFNSTVNSNQLNMALALTTSSGSQKRATMHRMLISRKQLNDKSIKLIEPQLKLNTDKIMISESKLKRLQQELMGKFSSKKEDLEQEVALECLKYIKEQCHKELYYTIDESIIYDSSRITDNKIIRSYIVSLLREYTDVEYYNKNK